MEYIYAALLLHKLGKPVDAESITKIMQAGGAQVDESKVKSLVASLKDVDIAKELETAVVASAAPVAGGAEAGAGDTEGAEPLAKEEKKEAAAEGLSALFG